MLNEKKKVVLVITLTVIALLIDMMMMLDYILFVCKAFDFYGRFLHKIHLFQWGWLIVFVLAGAAIGSIIYWKPGKVLFSLIVVFLLLVAIILALLWLFGLIMISTLKP
jgi:hypothetical protein